MKFFLLAAAILTCTISFSQEMNINELPENTDRLTFGHIEVPTDYSKPDGNKIPIAYVVIKSESAEPLEPVIIFNGGPGEITVKNYQQYFFLPFLANHDVIIFDQRGIGYSGGLPNMGPGVFDILASDLSMESEYEEMKQLVLQTKETSESRGIQLHLINTFQNAQDVGALMKHLGYPGYNFYGGSYGTRLARVTMDYFPDLVHSSVMIAPAPWESDFLTFRIKNFRKSLQLIFESCENDAECRSTYPALKQDYVDAIRALEDNPMEVTIAKKPFVINPQDAMYLLRYQLYTPGSKKNVPLFIKALKDRDLEYINSSQQFVNYIFNAVNFSMNLSVGRYEEYNTDVNQQNISNYYKDKDSFPAELAFFNSFYAAGTEWHNQEAEPEVKTFKSNDIPTLIFVNKYDPVTPPENGYLFKETLPNGILLVQDEEGHSGGGACRMGVVETFFKDPSVTPDTSCLKLVEN